MIIYKVTNLINNKLYIGQTKHSLLHRKNQHFRETKSKKDDMYFHRALNKYGFNNFKWEIIDQATSVEELNQKEIYYIQLYDSTNRINGYNRKLGGEQGLCSEETKILIGKSTKERWKNPETAKKMLAGLRKGTETAKQQALLNKNREFKLTCAYCNNKFISKTKSRKFCTENCYRLYMQTNDKGLQKAQLINEFKYLIKQNKIINLCNTYLLNNNILNSEYLVIFNNLLQLTNIKDRRTLLKFLNLKSMKDFKNNYLSNY